MRSLLAISFLFIFTGCNGSLGSVSTIQGVSVASYPLDPGAPNIMTVTVGGNSVCTNVNSPCVSVTVCKPGTTNCQTITDVLLDTGSFGLRLFNTSTVQSLGLTPINAGSGSLAECFEFLDGSADWGPIAKADVILGKEKTTQSVSIQIIDSSFGKVPSTCPNPVTDPSSSKFNGILGIGNYIADCGPGCANSTLNDFYFSCNGNSCNRTTVGEYDQVSNPVAFLPLDNNGSVLRLPDLPSAGVAQAIGYLALGIGTRDNNTLNSATVLTLDGNGQFKTQFLGVNYLGFVDSGSNGLYFDNSNSQLPKAASGFFDPSTLLSFSAIVSGGGVYSNISFEILPASVSFNPQSPNRAFKNIGGDLGTYRFDWGIPFFYGRAVATSIEGGNSNLGYNLYVGFQGN